MSEWKTVNLIECIRTNTSSIDSSYKYEAIVYLDTGSITCNKVDSLQEILLADAPSRARRLVKDQDIIYSSVRPNQLHYGFIINPIPNLVVSTGFVVIESIEEKIIPKFLYYFLTQSETTEYLHTIAEASTSAYPSLKPSDIEALEITLPPLPEQRAIASVLSSIDDKIDLLHRQNKTIEALAETLFRKMFIEDAPQPSPRPSPSGRGSEEEEADEGWEVQPLGNLVTVKRGGSPRPIQDYLSDTGLRWLKISDASKEDSPYIFEIKEHIKETGLNKTTLLKKGTLVLSNSATPGIPKILQIDTCIHDGWLHFPDSHFSNEFLYLLFKSIREELISHGNGSIFTNLKTDILKDYKIPIPEKKQLQVFQESVELMFNKILHNAQQIRTLENLRDTLLPKLMSGEVRVEI